MLILYCTVQWSLLLFELVLSVILWGFPDRRYDVICIGEGSILMSLIDCSPVIISGVTDPGNKPW